MNRTEAEAFLNTYHSCYEELLSLDKTVKLLRSPISGMEPPRNPEDKYIFYHYTSLFVFHNIVENQEFWAHNTRFSNDYMEERLVSQSFLNEYDNYCRDHYFICLCGGNDLLSQWRGYCPGGGVSIELSFPDKLVDFTVLGKTGRNMPEFYSCPLPVSYFKMDSYKNRAPLQSELKRNNRIQFLPLIKNAYFYEEQEYRVLFANKEHALDNCIFERALENETCVPYIKVKFNEISDRQISRRAALDDLSYEKLMTDLCITREGRHFVVIPSCPQQESIYNNLSKKLKVYYKGQSIKMNASNRITLLCAGKPPITGVKISPMPDRERIREQIEHVCSTRYWLRDVPVTCSDIPYTDSLGKK